MKVLFVMHNTEQYSGANLAMLEVIENLSSDIEKIILFPNKTGSAINYANKKGYKTLSTYYNTLLLSQNDSGVKNMLKSLLNIIRRIKMVFSCHKIKPFLADIDLVYTNTSTIKFGIMLSNALRIPHIWHIREFGDKDHGLLYPFGKKRYYYKTSGKNKHIIAISKCLISDIEMYFDKKKIHLVYDDVSINYINPDKEIIYGLNILVAGDIKEGKGQLVCVEAMKLLLENGIENAQMYIAGKTGDQNYYNKIADFVEKNNLGNNVHFLGRVSDMNSLRKKMNIGIVASKSEAFGRVTVEGMLSKMAMIGRNTGATVELINDGINGLLYDGSSEDLAVKIHELSDINRRGCIVENAFKYAKEKFTSGLCSQKIENIIRSVGEERNG